MKTPTGKYPLNLHRNEEDCLRAEQSAATATTAAVAERQRYSCYTQMLLLWYTQLLLYNEDKKAVDVLQYKCSCCWTYLLLLLDTDDVVAGKRCY